MSKAAEAVSEKISDSVCETVTDMLREAGFKDAKFEANDKDLFAPLIDAAVAPLVEMLKESLCPNGGPSCEWCRKRRAILEQWRQS